MPNTPPPPDRNPIINEQLGYGSSGSGSNSSSEKVVTETDAYGNIKVVSGKTYSAKEYEQKKTLDAYKELKVAREAEARERTRIETPEEQALALATSQENVKFSPKAEALRSRLLAESKKKSTGEYSETTLGGQRFGGTAGTFSPERIEKKQEIEIEKKVGTQNIIGNGNWSIWIQWTSTCDTTYVNSTGIYNGTGVASGSLMAEAHWVPGTILNTGDKLNVTYYTWVA